MAIQSPDVLAQRIQQRRIAPAPNVALQTKANEEAKARDAKRTFNERDFKLGIDTGTDIVGNRETESQPKKVTISKETENKITHFLEDYLTQVSQVLPRLRGNENARVDLMLYDALTTDGKPDAGKIEKYFDNDQAWG